MPGKVKAHILRLDDKHTDHSGEVRDKLMLVTYDNVPHAITMSTTDVVIPNKPEPRFNTIEELLNATRPDPKPGEMGREVIAFYNEPAPVRYTTDLKKLNEEMKKERVILRQTSWRRVSSKQRSDNARSETKQKAFLYLAIAAAVGVLILIAAIGIPIMLNR